MSACERCERAGYAAQSLRLGQTVCARCYRSSFTPAEIAELERGDRQREIAQAIRGSVGRIDGERRRQALRDRGLLIETSGSVDEVLGLVDEVAEFGLRMEVRR